KVVPIPGAFAAITALSVAGLPSDRFCYEGFLPAKQKARCEALKQIIDETRTTIYYESPHRIIASLEDIASVLGPDRYVVLAKELTKQFETIIGLPVAELIQWIQTDANRQRGEMVLLIAGVNKEDKSQSISTEAL